MSGLESLKYFVLDIDGTLTDGGIYYDEHGNELKKFSVRDSPGMFAAQACGIRLIVVTGRMCAATERRMHELGVDYVFQGVGDKYGFLTEFMEQEGLTSLELGYIGDDLNDLKAMGLSSFVGCPADSCDEVKVIADYVSPVKGGDGAVRDVLCHVLKKRGQWDSALNSVYGQMEAFSKKNAAHK